MVAEHRLIVEVKIIVTALGILPRPSGQTIVKCRIQMIILPADAHDIPGVAVFDAFFRIVAANRNHTP
jgi:hypothetical protein